MPIIYTAVVYPASAKQPPYTIEVWTAHCNPSALIAAQIASEYVEKDNDAGLGIFPRWQVFAIDTDNPTNTRDRTGLTIEAMVSQMRSANICRDCPPWWQEYAPTLCDWELAGWDHEAADAEARAEADADRRAYQAACGWPGKLEV